MRIITCAQMGIACAEDRRALLDSQCEDGSWEPGWMYQYGSTRVKIGNRAVTTAMAVAALSSREIVTKGNGQIKASGVSEIASMNEVGQCWDLRVSGPKC